MKITNSDGSSYELIDMCSHCQLNTAGQHETLCPLYESPQVKALRAIQEIAYGKFTKWEP